MNEDATPSERRSKVASGPNRSERFPAVTSEARARSVRLMARVLSSKSCSASRLGTQARTRVPFQTIGTSCPLYTEPSIILLVNEGYQIILR